MPSSITDFRLASRIVSEMTQQPVQLRDNPEAGRRGAVDPQDTFERSGSAQGVRGGEVLGVDRFNELTFRLNVVQAAKDLAASGAQFSGSEKGDKVNKALWTLGYGGRMQVRKFLPGDRLGSPAAALRDIFSNGRQYGFECATAMMAIFHKAILDTVGDKAFDAMFSEPRNLTFFRWSVKDNDFEAMERMDHSNNELVAGNHYYYTNPEASAENSAFAGENVIYLGTENGEKMFYGHGVVGARGDYVVTERELLRSLSSLRRAGATVEPSRELFSYSLDVPTLLERARNA